eukprot:1996801-Karenia_brevis.AAC.1
MQNGWSASSTKGRDIGWPTIGLGAHPRHLPYPHLAPLGGSIMVTPVPWVQSSSGTGRDCGGRRERIAGRKCTT